MHGDFGRTVPNVADILGVGVDIVGLDVMNVALQWPPVKSDKHSDDNEIEKENGKTERKQENGD